MKKSLAVLSMLMIMMLAVTGCGLQPDTGNSVKKEDDSSKKDVSTQTDDENEDHDEVLFDTKGESVIFTVSLDFELDDSSAWLGIIPTGTKYKDEVDADDVDMVYCYAANYDDESKKNYRFEFEKEYFFSVGDGTYDMVLTSSDDGEIGKVLLQIGIEIDGEKITLDFENKN